MAASIELFTNKNTEAPVTGGEAITPHASINITNVTRAIWVGVAGDVTAVMKDGQVLLFTGLSVGWHPLRVSRINAIGTTATNMTAVW
jgi:hypothetical protein